MDAKAALALLFDDDLMDRVWWSNHGAEGSAETMRTLLVEAVAPWLQVRLDETDRLEARIEQLKGTVSQLGDAMWLAEQTRLHDELTKVTARQHDWEFYANGTFCRRCGAQIGSGVPCR